MKTYIVIKEENLNELESMVQESIAAGFTPTGGVSVVTEEQDRQVGYRRPITYYLQAVFKNPVGESK
ncbi:MAG: DUF1737 domain-containing protein [Gammaproteobacteria bacterium]|nr:DUF1737 domain-containing protein [Gammaproteobacteria bacterium]